MDEARLIIGHIAEITKQVKLAICGHKPKTSDIRLDLPHCALFVGIELHKLSTVFIFLAVSFVKVASVEHPALRGEHNCMQWTASYIDYRLLWL